MKAMFITFGVVLIIIVTVVVHARIARENDARKFAPYITYSRLVYTADKCDKYKNQKGEWPNSMEQLHAFRIDLNDPLTQDAWGRELVLIPYNKSVGYGEILSYGRDGGVGGTGLDRDLVVRFPTEANAAWNKRQGDGLEQPQWRP